MGSIERYPVAPGMFVRGRHRDNSNNIGCVLAAGTTNACVWWFFGKQRRVVSLETLRERYMPVDLAGAESVLGEGKAIVPLGTVPLSLDEPPEQPPARVTLSIELDGDDARRWLELLAHRGRAVRALGGDIGDRGLVVALVRKAHSEEIEERGAAPAQQQLFSEKG